MTDIYQAALNTEEANRLKLKLALLFGERHEYVEGERRFLVRRFWGIDYLDDKRITERRKA